VSVSAKTKQKKQRKQTDSNILQRGSLILFLVVLHFVFAETAEPNHLLNSNNGAHREERERHRPTETRVHPYREPDRERGEQKSERRLERERSADGVRGRDLCDDGAELSGVGDDAEAPDETDGNHECARGIDQEAREKRARTARRHCPDSDALAAEAISLLGEPARWQRMSEASRASAVARFARAATVDAYEACYRRVLG